MGITIRILRRSAVRAEIFDRGWAGIFEFPGVRGANPTGRFGPRSISLRNGLSRWDHALDGVRQW